MTIAAAGNGGSKARLFRRRAVMFRVMVFAAGAMIAAALLACAELVFKLVNDRAEARVITRADEMLEFYLPLGYRPRASTVGGAAKIIDGRTVYDAAYTIDEFHRRAVPENPSADRFLLVFGCSVAFGEGVGDDESLPSQLATRLPDTQVYNYGYSGYGPQQALALLSNEAVVDGVTPAAGDAVYVFLPGHVRRANGSMRMWTAWGRHFPCYTLNDGYVTLQGTFLNARPWRSRLYDLLGRSQTVRYAHVDWPLWIRNADLELTAAILSTARDAYRERFPTGEFSVVLFPDLPNNEFAPDRIVPFLERANIAYCDLSHAMDMSAPDMTIPGDGHPSAKGYSAVADMLASRLRQSSSSMPRQTMSPSRQSNRP